MKIKKRYLWISLSVAITFGILIGFLCFLQLAKIPLDTPTWSIDTTAWGQATGVISIFAIFLGFATLMFGMEAMSDAVSGLADVPEFQNLFLAFTNPILGVLVGAIVTAIIQSSSSMVE